MVTFERNSTVRIMLLENSNVDFSNIIYRITILYNCKICPELENCFNSIRFDFIRLSLNGSSQFLQRDSQNSRGSFIPWQSAKLIVTLDTNLRRRRETVRCDSVGRRTAIGTRLKESNTS